MEELFSDRFKIRMNRIFREQAGIKNIPHPEMDNLYEKIRSGIIRGYLLMAHRLRNKIKRKWITYFQSSFFLVNTSDIALIIRVKWLKNRIILQNKNSEVYILLHFVIIFLFKVRFMGHTMVYYLLKFR